MSDGVSQDPPNEVPPIEDNAESANDSQADSGQGKTDAGPPSTPVEVVISGELKIRTESEDTEVEDKSSKWPNALTIFSGLLALFTLLLVIVATFQAKILFVTNETLSLQQRAWLGPRGMLPPKNFMERVNNRTEVDFYYENTGREPAIKTNLTIIPGVIKVDDFHNEKVLTKTVRNLLNGRTCDTLPLNPNGPAIYPGGKPKVVIGFDSEYVEKINSRNYYALMVGCLVYETLNERHRSEFCGILEPITGEADHPSKWRTSFCTIHNDAN